MSRRYPATRQDAVHQAGIMLLSVAPEVHRYDVVINRVMPYKWADRWHGYFWYWCVDVSGFPVASGYAWTEHGAERKAALCAQQHARPPRRAQHCPARTYSINL